MRDTAMQEKSSRLPIEMEDDASRKAGAAGRSSDWLDGSWMIYFMPQPAP